MVKVDSWYSNRRTRDAAKWSFDFFNETGMELARTLSYQQEMYMAQVGWPTNSTSTNHHSSASLENLQIFINNFVCTANTQGVKYFFFEYMDIPRKQNLLTDVGGFWGPFNNDRTLKAITLPDCAHG